MYTRAECCDFPRLNCEAQTNKCKVSWYLVVFWQPVHGMFSYFTQSYIQKEIEQSASVAIPSVFGVLKLSFIHSYFIWPNRQKNTKSHINHHKDKQYYIHRWYMKTGRHHNAEMPGWPIKSSYMCKLISNGVPQKEQNGAWDWGQGMHKGIKGPSVLILLKIINFNLGNVNGWK